MQTDRRKNASLAINAILRGLESDQLVFKYDETACPDIACMAAGRGFAASGGGTGLTAISSSGLLELAPLERTTTAA
jgi:hypothetical protein